MYYTEARRRMTRRIMNKVPVSEETAYSMILMTAALMDLRPDDDQVVDMILEDCGCVGICES